MKIVAISDTHTRHHDVILPEGDMLIHAGDISSTGTRQEIADFLMWFSQQPHEFKIVIAGNHDWMFEKQPGEAKSYIPDNVIYLENSGIKINDFNIWGSPVQPTFHHWAFNVERGEEIKRYWDLIPSNTDILITHSPPFGILDKNHVKEHVGCEELAKKVELIKPVYHIFGHIHQGYGQISNQNTNFINASLLNEKYIYTNEPIVFEI